MNNMDFTGVVIEESLENKSVLQDIQITNTKIEPATEEHKTPWVTQWTLHRVFIPAKKIEEIADRVSHALDSQHPWYADFKNDTTHYIIFHNKTFKVDRSRPGDYKSVTEYGLSLGIPDYQLDFSPHIEEWRRQSS